MRTSYTFAAETPKGNRRNEELPGISRDHRESKAGSRQRAAGSGKGWCVQIVLRVAAERASRLRDDGSQVCPGRGWKGGPEAGHVQGGLHGG